MLAGNEGTQLIIVIRIEYAAIVVMPIGVIAIITRVKIVFTQTKILSLAQSGLITADYMRERTR